MGTADDSRRQAARRFATKTLALGLVLPFALGLLARIWRSSHGQPAASWLEGLVTVLLPTVLLILPVYAVLARVAFRSLLRTDDWRRQGFKLRGAVVGLTAVCVAVLLGLLLEGQLSLLALVVIPFWMACAISAGVGYRAGGFLAGRRRGPSS